MLAFFCLCCTIKIIKLYYRKEHIVKRHIFFGGFQRKLLMCFIFSSLIPLLLAVCIFYTASVAIAKDKILNTAELSSRQLYESVIQRLEQIEQLSDSVQYYVYRFSTSPERPSSEYLSFYNYARSFISSMSDCFNLLSIEIYLNESCFISNEGLMFKGLSSLEGLMAPEELLKTGVNTGWKLFPKRSMSTPARPNPHPENCLTYYCSKFNRNSNSLDYVYFLNISCDELSLRLANAFGQSDLSVYIMDPEGLVIAASNPAMEGSYADSEFRHDCLANIENWFSCEKNRYYVRQIHGAPLMLVTCVPNVYIQKNTGILINVLLVAAFAILTATCFTVYFITKTFTRRIFILSHTIDNFRRDGEHESLKPLMDMVDHPQNTWDEIDYLANSFVEMSARLDDSFQKILHMSLSEEKLNYRLLQSKINPHFLYNILESIKTCQTLGYIDTANLMITKLAKFYRQLLQKGDDMITICDELNIVVTYIEIENLCRQDNIHYTVNMDDGIDHFLICKFTLQPIVENCIVHGIRSSSQSLTIQINIKYEEDIILIQVIDDGNGISPEKLKELQQTLTEKTAFYSRHYGISNVNARLSINSHGDAQVLIQSTLGQGTTVTILIPQVL